MLTAVKQDSRKKFYTSIFGQDWVDKQKIIRPALWNTTSYDEKIEGLSKRGFTNPQKMIASLPAILGLSFENIDEKIEVLSKRGFTNPQKMIASLPAILGYSFENIDEKLRKAKRLKANVDEFIAYTVIFIGMSAKHYVPILRKCMKDEVIPCPKSVFRIYRNKSFIS